MGAGGGATCGRTWALIGRRRLPLPRVTPPGPANEGRARPPPAADWPLRLINRRYCERPDIPSDKQGCRSSNFFFFFKYIKPFFFFPRKYFQSIFLCVCVLRKKKSLIIIRVIFSPALPLSVPLSPAL